MSLSVEFPISPCPQLFQYKQENNLWTGNLKVYIQRNEFPLHIRLHLCLRAALKTKYAGLLELTQPAEVVLDEIKNSLNGVYVNYTVRFPLPWPLPTLRMISLNNLTICQGLEITGGVVTNIFLEHTFPTNTEFFQDVFHPNHYENDCGIIPQKGLIYDEAKLDHWPWLAAVLIQRPSGLEFHCSGTLISDKYILTAAHCVKHTKYGDLHPEVLVIYLGRHNLNKWGEPNSQVRLVHQTSIHPDFTDDYYDSDVAVLALSQPAVLNAYVRPICLWTDSSLDIIGQIGIVVGWGKDHSKGRLRMEPRSIQLPIASQEDCLRSRKDFMYITSSRTLCAGLRNGTGPCNGDSGSGLMLIKKLPFGKIWHLRGIISLSLYDRYNETCDLSQYLVFTDVAKFIEWIFLVTNISL
ncbi:serine protease gd-like isoform X2 [Rhodnius prolixus]|uniref:Peptidase S1 domain-containing protein n=2 Tax=Rhodnius prolixus TaxID=13249 RepID=T1HAY5_RHOPR